MYASSIGVGKTVAKVNRVSYDILRSIGIETTISSKTVAANQIIGYVRALENSGSSSVQTLYKLVNDRVEALEFRIAAEEDAFYLGSMLKELQLRDNVIIGCILRKGKIIYPCGDDTIENGDSVTVITSHHGFKNFEEIFC